MNDAVDTFGTVFSLVAGLMALIGLLIAGLGITGIVLVLRRSRRRNRTRTHGLVAEAAVLETYLTQDRVADSLTIRTGRHVVLGFRTADGQDIRLKDTTGIPRIAGDRVTVRYLPERPREAIPTDVPGTGQNVGHTIVLVICSFFTLFGLVFAATTIGMAVFANQMPTEPPTPGNWP
ncbi:DUF3592 domain-containing protein [Kitasatospora sp. NPDC059673]|uniref:DUF3592 domain-containing protein n=1 Tax=Kitasatospora sp. NPDC059673 TaxID=3346901 RepID=UPI0036A49FF7